MSDVASDPPWEPPLAGSEIEHLLGALNRQRWTFRWKADGLDAAGLELRVGSSALTLGGLLKHLAAVEELASSWQLAGEEPDWPTDPGRWRTSEGWEETLDAQGATPAEPVSASRLPARTREPTAGRSATVLARPTVPHSS
jgi:hypothetical protein